MYLESKASALGVFGNAVGLLQRPVHHQKWKMTIFFRVKRDAGASRKGYHASACEPENFICIWSPKLQL